MRLLILGGDGFCGWPTSLHLSAAGHEVAIVDNFARRKADVELEVESLTPIGPLEARLAAWREIVRPQDRLPRARRRARLRGPARPPARVRPDAVVHFAEQRAAPYSMKSAAPQALHRRQQHQRDAQPAGRDRRVRARHPRRPPRHDGRLRLRRRRRSDPRGLPARDGSTPTTAATVEQEILYPANPGSVYHMTKTLDQLLFAFYNKNDEVRDHRPAPGHRLGHPDRRDPARRAADQPLRLRRRLRHRAQPLPHAGRDRLPADRARHRRPDARLHPHPGHASAASSSPSPTRRSAASASGSSTR